MPECPEFHPKNRYCLSSLIIQTMSNSRTQPAYELDSGLCYKKKNFEDGVNKLSANKILSQ
jgi:hypothetical protein